MVEKVWVGKKVRVLSLEELEKNHYKDRYGYFWYSKESFMKFGVDDSIKKNCIYRLMQRLCGKVCEVSEEMYGFFQIKEDSDLFSWHLWMVKEPVTIEDILNSE